MLLPILTGKKPSQIFNVHTQVKLFNEILTNIFTNFVPIKLITVDDRDPPWVTENIKKLLKDKNYISNTLKTKERKDTMENV